MQQVKWKRLHEAAVLPKAAHAGDALDLSSAQNAVLYANVPKLVRTGWAIELPEGFRAWVTPRSGLALKNGITVLNAPGLIDPQYRGEVGVILLWNGFSSQRESAFQINAGDRIAQLTIERIEPFEHIEASELTETTRNAGGFGSTGR